MKPIISLCSSHLWKIAGASTAFALLIVSVPAGDPVHKPGSSQSKRQHNSTPASAGAATPAGGHSVVIDEFGRQWVDGRLVPNPDGTGGGHRRNHNPTDSYFFPSPLPGGTGNQAGPTGTMKSGGGKGRRQRDYSHQTEPHPWPTLWPQAGGSFGGGGFGRGPASAGPPPELRLVTPPVATLRPGLNPLPRRKPALNPLPPLISRPAYFATREVPSLAPQRPSILGTRFSDAGRPLSRPEVPTIPPDEEVGVLAGGLTTPSTSGSTLTLQVPQPDDRLVFFLSSLGCSDVTNGGPVEIGKDQLTMAYAVLVGYEDRTYRVWGDYLYMNWEVGDPWNERRSRIDNIMAAVSFFPPPSQTPKEASVSEKRIRYIRIGICMMESEPGEVFASTQNVPGDGGVTQFLNREAMYSPYPNWADSLTGPHDLALKLEAMVRFYDRDADTIGVIDHIFINNDLKLLFLYATDVENEGDVEELVSHPLRLGYESSDTTFDSFPHDQYYRNANIPSSFGGVGTGDSSRYDYYISCLVGPQAAFAEYIPPVTPENFDEPFAVLTMFREWLVVNGVRHHPELEPWWREGTAAR